MLEDPTHERFYSEGSLARGLLAAGAAAVTVGPRPALDSLGCDGASYVRAWRPDQDAALGSTAGLGISAALVVPTPLGRAVSTSMRPVLDAVAVVP